MASERNIADYKRILVVEGYGDLLFFAELLERVNKHNEVYIQQLGGKSGLLKKLEAFLSAELLAEKESIAIVLDADTNAGASIQSLANSIQKATGRTLEHGFWLDGQPRLGFYVVPDGKEAGEIETLVWNAWAGVEVNASAKACVENYLNCMGQLNFSAKSPDKGKIGALLAVRNDDDPRLGPGSRANKTIFDFTRDEYKPLLKFLSGL